MMGIYAVIGLGIIALPGFFNIKVHKLLFVFGVITIVLSVSLMGAFIEPPTIYDIYRHYLHIDSIRAHQWGIGYTVFKGVPSIDSNYNFTFVFNFIIAVIAKYLPNEALPFITSLGCYSVFVYVFFKEFNGDKNIERYFIVSLLLCSILMPYLYVYSGIRNALGASIAALGIYRYFRVNRNLIELAILIMAAFMIHTFVITSAIAIAMYRFRPKVKWFIFVVVFPHIIDPIMEWCRLSSGNDMLFRIGAKYYNYTRVREDNQGLVFKYVPILMLALMSVLLLLRVRKQKNSNTFSDVINSSGLRLIKTEFVKNEDYLANGLWWYVILALGFIKAENMILRFPMVLSVLSPFLIKTIYHKEISKKSFSYVNAIFLLIILSIALLILYENIAWLS